MMQCANRAVSSQKVKHSETAGSHTAKVPDAQIPNILKYSKYGFIPNYSMYHFIPLPTSLLMYNSYQLGETQSQPLHTQDPTATEYTWRKALTALFHIH